MNYQYPNKFNGNYNKSNNAQEVRYSENLNEQDKNNQQN